MTLTLDMLRDLVRPNITGDGSAKAVATSARTLADVVEAGHDDSIITYPTGLRRMVEEAVGDQPGAIAGLLRELADEVEGASLEHQGIKPW